MSKNLDWAEINDPWVEHETFPELIEEKANILDILDKLDIEYINSFSGEFSHKLRCPLPSHSSGNERTASMFICADKNSFYCFGCNSGGNVTNFIMRMHGLPFYEALKWLAEAAGITGADASDIVVKKERRDPDKTVVFQTLRTGTLIRDHLSSKKKAIDYNRWLVWADKRFKKLDIFLDTVEDKDWEVVNDYYCKIKSFIDRNK